MLFCELLRHERVMWAPGGAGVAVKGLTLDSRVSGYGFLFFCVRGARLDGHDFAKDAYARGCRHFAAEHQLGLPGDASILICPSVEKKMAMLASRYYCEPEKEMRIIGITGTKGKTTTALMMRDLLDEVGIESAYIGSLGVMLGDGRITTENTTPPSLDLYRYLRMIADRGIRTVIMEVSSQALACDRVFGLPFFLGVLTNLSRDHIGAGEHSSMEEYREAKRRMFIEHSPSFAILNAEDDFSFDVMKAVAEKSVVLYGNGEGSHMRYRAVRQYREANRLYTSFLLNIEKEEHSVTLGFAGAHYILDFLAALSASGLVSGAPPKALLARAPRLAVAGRSEVYGMRGGALLVIDYAHNGASLGAALYGLRPYTRGRLFCLFGAVGERTGCRRADMAAAAERFADFSVITEDNPGGEDPEAIAREIATAFCDRTRCVIIPNREEAIAYLCGVARDGDVVLLAGKGNEEYQLLAEGRVPYCERTVIERLGFLRGEK